MKLINNEDISTKDKDRRDYQEDEKMQAIEYRLKSKTDIQSIIDNIANINDLQDYKVVDCHNELVGTWNVTWNKILYDDIVNPYDVVNVSIDAKDGSITMFSRNSIIPDTIKATVTKEEAIDYAKPIIKKLIVMQILMLTLLFLGQTFIGKMMVLMKKRILYDLHGK